jgi:hypothetical protein
VTPIPRPAQPLDAPPKAITAICAGCAYGNGFSGRNHFPIKASERFFLIAYKIAGLIPGNGRGGQTAVSITSAHRH